jgi:hypothetical protein
MPEGEVREEVAGRPLAERRETSGLTTADLAAGVGERSSQQALVGAAGSPSRQDAEAPLFTSEENQKLQSDWDRIQTAFVDDPRASVQRADGLVADVMQRLAQAFSEERKNLEVQWESGGDASTEDLRMALQRYRSFFSRLLSI